MEVVLSTTWRQVGNLSYLRQVGNLSYWRQAESLSYLRMTVRSSASGQNRLAQIRVPSESLEIRKVHSKSA